MGVGGTHHPSLLTWQLETPLRGRGQSSLSRTHPRGPLFPRPPPSSQPWVRLMELRQLQQWGAGGGGQQLDRGKPLPLPGQSPARAGEKERRGLLQEPPPTFPCPPGHPGGRVSPDPPRAGLLSSGRTSGPWSRQPHTARLCSLRTTPSTHLGLDWSPLVLQVNAQVLTPPSMRKGHTMTCGVEGWPGGQWTVVLS